MMPRGFALLVTLIFLLLFSLLGIAAFTHSQLQIRMANNFQSSAEEFYAAEIAISIAEQQLQKQPLPNCIIDYLPHQQYDVPWLQQKACSTRVADSKIFYLYERLKQSSCVQQLNGNLTLGDYYRISAWQSVADYLPALLQVTFITPTNHPCSAAENAANYHVMVGRLSWSQLL